MTDVNLNIGRRRVLAGALSAVALAGCGGAQPKAAGARLRVGFQKNGILLLAKRSGRLDEAMKAEPAAQVEWLEFSSGPPLLEAMSVGSLDLGYTGDTPPIFAQAAGAPIMYVAAAPLSGAAGGILVPAKSTAKTVADLKGKRFCFTRASSAHNSAAVLLEQAGLTLNDIEPINLSPADASAAFAQGNIDGWLIWDPFFTSAVNQLGARALPTNGLPPSHAFALAHRDFVEKQPALLIRALNALAAEGEWAANHRDEVAALQAKETGLPLELLKQTAQRDDFRLRPITSEIIAAQQTIADRFFKLGLIPKQIATADASFTGWTPA